MNGEAYVHGVKRSQSVRLYSGAGSPPSRRCIAITLFGLARNFRRTTRPPRRDEICSADSPTRRAFSGGNSRNVGRVCGKPLLPDSDSTSAADHPSFGLAPVRRDTSDRNAPEDEGRWANRFSTSPTRVVNDPSAPVPASRSELGGRIRNRDARGTRSTSQYRRGGCPGRRTRGGSARCPIGRGEKWDHRRTSGPPQINPSIDFRNSSRPVTTVLE